MTVRENSKVQVVVRGQPRTVSVGKRKPTGGFVARLRAPYTGNSVRGTLRETAVGLRFTPTNRDSLNNL